MRKFLIATLWATGLWGLSVIAADFSGYFNQDIEKETQHNSHFALNSSSVSGYCLPSAAGIHNTGAIETTIDLQGRVGTRGARRIYNMLGLPPEPLPAFQIPAGSGVEYLYQGAIWIGGIIGNDTLVSMGTDGWSTQMYDFFTPLLPEMSGVTTFASIADSALRGFFCDTLPPQPPIDFFGYPPREMGLRVANRSYAWHTSPLNKTIIYDFVVTNIADSVIRDAYFGMFFDGDACFDCSATNGASDDLAGSIPEMGVAYILDNDGDMEKPQEQQTPNLFAFKFISSSFDAAISSFNWWVPGGSPHFEDNFRSFGPVMVDSNGNTQNCEFWDGYMGWPNTDAQRYCMMSSGEWDYDQCRVTQEIPGWMTLHDSNVTDVSGDTRFVMSLGPFDLLPDSSVRVLFATFTADSVHVVADNFSSNLPHDPDTWLDNLNLDDMLANAAISDSLGMLLLDPEAEPIGLHVQFKSVDSVVIEWDPYVFDDVEGYEIYLAELSHDLLPNPGVAAPWMLPSAYSLIASTGRTYRYVFEGLDPHQIYFARIVHRTLSGFGLPSVPVPIHVIDSLPALQIDQEFVFAYADGDPVTIAWTPRPDVEGDHYNLYRFDSIPEPLELYHCFYDDGCMSAWIAPADSFFVDDRTFYWYAMQPWVTVEADDTFYVDTSPEEGMVYYVTAVNEHGVESDIAGPITMNIISARTRDVLVITNSNISYNGVIKDSVRSFYDSVLAGLDYEILSLDTSSYLTEDNQPSRFRWRNLMPFDLVIIDDGLGEATPDGQSNHDLNGLTRYLLSIGRLAICGALDKLEGASNGMGTFGEYYETHSEFTSRFLSFDSLNAPGVGYFAFAGLSADTLFGFIGAAPALAELPPLYFDTTRDIFTERLHEIWPDTTAPNVAAFGANESGEVLYRYRSKYPATSVVEDDVVGLKATTDLTITYLFGFHFWYMEHEGVRALIDYMLADDPPQPGPAPLPRAFHLSQNYPNPFNQGTTISYNLNSAAHVELEIFNILGQRVRTLINGRRVAGPHDEIWDGRDSHGAAVASGIYLYRLEAAERSETKKMALVR